VKSSTIVRQISQMTNHSKVKILGGGGPAASETLIEERTGSQHGDARWKKFYLYGFPLIGLKKKDEKLRKGDFRGEGISTKY